MKKTDRVVVRQRCDNCDDIIVTLKVAPTGERVCSDDCVRGSINAHRSTHYLKTVAKLKALLRD